MLSSGCGLFFLMEVSKPGGAMTQHDEHMYAYRMWLWTGHWDLPYRIPMLKNYSSVVTVISP
jgi:hypothetical protein